MISHHIILHPPQSSAPSTLRLMIFSMHQNLSPSQQQFLDQHRNPIHDATVTTTNDSLSVALSHDRIIEETYKRSCCNKIHTLNLCLCYHSTIVVSYGSRIQCDKNFKGCPLGWGLTSTMNFGREFPIAKHFCHRRRNRGAMGARAPQRFCNKQRSALFSESAPFF